MEDAARNAASKPSFDLAQESSRNHALNATRSSRLFQPRRLATAFVVTFALAGLNGCTNFIRNNANINGALPPIANADSNMSVDLVAELRLR